MVELKEGVEENGFDPKYDKAILAKLYGDYHGENWQKTIYDLYSICAGAALSPEEEREQKGFAYQQKCKDAFLRELKEGIKRLDRYREEQTAVFFSKLELESLRQNVPDTPQLDRLLRYEANLDRSFDRTLSQLERIQRMRHGLPVPAPIKISVSS